MYDEVSPLEATFIGALFLSLAIAGAVLAWWWT
jgi:hypothetical protein